MRAQFRKPARRPARFVWRLARPVLLTAAFVIPVYLFVANRTPSPPPRLSVSQAWSLDLTRVRVPVYRQAVPVLTYHDISNRPGRYMVTPERFRGQMAALAQADFHTITVAQLLAFLERGAALPSRPLLLTFDDGLGSAWRAADPVLQAYGLHAVSFVISGQLDRHGFYYLHPDELKEMIQSGRWDVEAHTHLGHELVPANARGGTGPFLTNRAWLPQQHRLETLAEYRLRVSHDLETNIAELRSYGADPQMFAYPFSAVNAPADDPRVIPILRQLVAERFPVSFVDANKGRYLDRWDGASEQELPRIEVFAGTTPRALLRRLFAADPLPPSTSTAFRQPDDWTFDGVSLKAGRQAFRPDALELSPPARQWQAAYYALARSDSWQSYRLQTVITGFGEAGSSRTLSARRASANTLVDGGTSASILLHNAPARIGGAAAPRYAVSVSVSHLSVAALPTGSAEQRLASVHIPPRSQHKVQILLSRERLRVSVDGKARANVAVSALSHGGFGLGVWRQRTSGRPVSFTRLVVQPT